MKVFLLLLLLAFAMAARADELWNQALAAEKAGRFPAASQLYEKSGDIAFAAGDKTAAFNGLHRAGITASMTAADARAFALSTRAIALADEILPKLEGPERKTVHMSRIESREIREAALSAMDRYAEGYAELRSLWRDMGQYRVAEEGGEAGDPLQAASLAGWTPAIRYHVWRSFFREAEYMDIMGHTQEAQAILRHGIQLVSALGRLDDRENTYAAQLRTVYAGKLEFLGYHRDGIETLRAALLDENVRLGGQLNWSTRLNFAYRTQRHEGPNQDLIEMADECVHELIRGSLTGRDAAAVELLATMRADYARAYDEAGNLRRVRYRPQWLDGAFPAARSANGSRQDDMPLTSRYLGGYLSSRRAKAAVSNELASATEPGLEEKFVRLLHQTRREGNKHAEPAVYTAYGNYLRRTGRAADSLGVYREALRLTESFGWTLLAPRARMNVIGALYDMRDFASAEVEWAVLENRLAAVPDLTAKVGLDYRTSRIEWHLTLGEAAKAQAAIVEARAFAAAQKLNAWKRNPLDSIPFDPRMITAVPQRPAPPVAQAPMVPVGIGPSRVVTGAAAGDVLRARFTVRNPDHRARAGEIRVRGPVTQLSLGAAPRLVTASAAAGSAEKEMRLPLVLGPGEELGVVIEMTPIPAEGAKSLLQVAWQEGPTRTAADWVITQERDPFVASVLNASHMRHVAFHSVAFTQQIMRRAEGPGLVNFRFTASTPLRLEYYDAATHRLLAVDANGNGVFTDPGDSLLADADGDLAPDVRFDGRERFREIRVAVFSTATAPAAGKQNIVAEVLTEKGWEKIARHELE